MAKEELDILVDYLDDDYLDESIGLMSDEITSLDPTKETRDYLAITEIRMNLHRAVEFSLNYIFETSKKVQEDMRKKQEKVIEYNSKDSNNQIKADRLKGLLNLLKSNTQQHWRISYLKEILDPADVKEITKFLEEVQNPSGFISNPKELETLYTLIEVEYNKTAFNNNALSNKQIKNNLQESIFTRNNFNKTTLPYDNFVENGYKYHTENFNIEGFSGFVKLDFDKIKNLYEIGVIEETILNNENSYIAIANKINNNSIDEVTQIKTNLGTNNLCGIIKYNNTKLLPSNLFKVQILNSTLLKVIEIYAKLVKLEGDYTKTDILLQEIVKLFNKQELPVGQRFSYNINYLEEELKLIKDSYSGQNELVLFKPFIQTLRNNGILFLNDSGVLEDQSVEELLQKISFSKYEFLTQTVGKQVTISYIGLKNYTKVVGDKSNIKSDFITASIDIDKKNLVEMSFGDISNFIQNQRVENLDEILENEQDPYVKFALAFLDKARDKYSSEPGKLDIDKQYVTLKVKNLIEASSLNLSNFKKEVNSLPKGRYSITSIEKTIVEKTLSGKELFLELLYDLLDKVIGETRIEQTYPRKELNVLDKEFSYVADTLDNSKDYFEVLNYLNREIRRPQFIKEIDKSMYYFLLANTYLNLIFPELNTCNILNHIPEEATYKEFETLPTSGLKEILEDRVTRLTNSNKFTSNLILIPEINFMKYAMNPKSRNVAEYQLAMFSYFVKKVYEVVSQLKKEIDNVEIRLIEEENNENPNSIKVEIPSKEYKFATELLSDIISNKLSQSIDIKGRLILSLDEILGIFPKSLRRYTYNTYKTPIDKIKVDSLKEVVTEIQLEGYGCNFLKVNDNLPLKELVLSKQDIRNDLLLLSDNTEFVTRLGLTLESDGVNYLETSEEVIDVDNLLETTNLKEIIKEKVAELALLKETSVTKSDIINVIYTSKDQPIEKYLDNFANLYAKLLFIIYEEVTRENILTLIQRIVDNKATGGVIDETVSKFINRKIKNSITTRFLTENGSINSLDNIIINTIDKLLDNNLLKNYIISGIKIKDNKTVLEEDSELSKTYNLFINRIQFLPIIALSYLNKRKLAETREKELKEKLKSKDLNFPNKEVLENMVNSLYDLYLQTGLEQPLERLEKIKIPNTNLTGFDLVSPLLLTQSSKPTYKLEGMYSQEALYKSFAEDLLLISNKLPENERINLANTYDFGVSISEVLDEKVNISGNGGQNEENRGSDSLYNKIRQIDLTQFVLDIEKYLEKDFVSKLPISLRKYLEEDSFIYLQKSPDDICPYLDTKLDIKFRIETGESLKNVNSLFRKPTTF